VVHDPSLARPVTALVQSAPLIMGFGWGLYGFFVAAAIWMAVYFYWAWRADLRDRAEARDRERHGR
jgi:hypothetical protein